MRTQNCRRHQEFFLELGTFFRLLSEGFSFFSLLNGKKTSQTYFMSKQQHPTNFAKAEEF